MYFSDVYADKAIPDHVRADKVLYGASACISIIDSSLCPSH